MNKEEITLLFKLLTKIAEELEEIKKQIKK